MKFRNKKRRFGRKGYFDNAPRPKKKINEDFSNVSLKKGKLITLMISNFPKNQNQYTLDAFLKSKGILCWGCRANYLAQVAFIDVEVKDCEKVLSLNEQEWNGLDLAVKIDETTNIRKKKTKNELVTKFETVERHRRTLCCRNVPFDVFSQKVETLFKGVKEVYIVRDKRTGRPTGIAFVEFFTEEDLENAFEKKDSVRMNGRKLNLSRCEQDTIENEQNLLSKYLPKVKDSDSEIDFEDEEEDEDKKSFFDRNKKKKGVKTIVLSNFPEGQKQSSLMKYLKRQGISVLECRANFETQTAFLDVEFKDVAKAFRLNSKLWNGYELSVEEETASKGKTIKANSNKPLESDLKMSDSKAERTLCCRNLPFGIFAQRLELLFQDVKEVRNLHDSFGQPTGMAYIEFFTTKALNAAYAKRDEIELDGRKIQMSLMGPLLKNLKSTRKRTLSKTEEPTKSKPKYGSPQQKRRQMPFKKHEKGANTNKYMRR